MQQTIIPDEYQQLSRDEFTARITERKQQLGDELVILGHHYQNDAVIRFADFRGDSLKLSQLAAEQRDAKFIVFCGVHFMAESADILSSDQQAVFLPNIAAGCAMADMAEDADVQTALDELQARREGKVLPVTYVNSTAAIKAITGQAGGTCCTSSNVRNVYEWALRDENNDGGGADLIFALPDQHLGRNTALAMGIAEEQIAVYNPLQPVGGLSDEQIATARVVLWQGHCYVHQLFTPEHVQQARRQHPGATVIVHPECPREVVDLADAAGSTSQIIQAVADAPSGSTLIIGTESNLVARLNAQHTDKTVLTLSETPALCMQMARITPGHLAWTLDELSAGRSPNRVSVPEDVADDARIALKRMISIRAVENVQKR